MTKRLVTLIAAALLALTLTGAADAKRPVPGIGFCDSYRSPDGPCVWDDVHMGDGDRKSFKVKANGDRFTISHKRAHRILFGSQEGQKQVPCGLVVYKR